MSDSNAGPIDSGGGPPAIVPPTNQEIINAWRNKRYYTYDAPAQQISITVQDFFQIMLTGHTHDNRSWLNDDQLTLPVALLAANERENPDMLVISPTPASILASVGLGSLTRDDFRHSCPGVNEAMAQNSIRWIIIPCNDGMTAGYDRQTAMEKAER
jgi:hypothetical protein